MRAAQVLLSVPLGGTTPLGCGCWEAAETVETVDVDEACDDREEDEFDRWALFRGMYMAPFAPPSALHACRLMF